MWRRREEREGLFFQNHESETVPIQYLYNELEETRHRRLFRRINNRVSSFATVN